MAVVQRHADHQHHDGHDEGGARQTDEERVVKVGPGDGILIGWKWIESHETNACDGNNIRNPGEQIAIFQCLPDRIVSILSLLMPLDALIHNGHTDSQEDGVELSVGLDDEDLEDEDVLRGE